MLRSPIAIEMKQIKLLKDESKTYGGELLRTRKGRSGPRPIDTRNTMHMVLRSSKAVKDWSFKRPTNEKKISEVVAKFSIRYGVKIISLANVGNYLHFHIKLTNRYSYKPFIRAVTSAIVMAITGTSRWKLPKKEDKIKFWDYRPFTRVIKSFRALLNLKDYLRINELEGYGCSRTEARFILASPHFIRARVPI